MHTRKKKWSINLLDIKSLLFLIRHICKNNCHENIPNLNMYICRKRKKMRGKKKDGKKREKECEWEMWGGGDPKTKRGSSLIPYPLKLMLFLQASFNEFSTHYSGLVPDKAKYFVCMG